MWAISAGKEFVLYSICDEEHGSRLSQERGYGSLPGERRQLLGPEQELWNHQQQSDF